MDWHWPHLTHMSRGQGCRPAQRAPRESTAAHVWTSSCNLVLTSLLKTVRWPKKFPLKKRIEDDTNNMRISKQ